MMDIAEIEAASRKAAVLAAAEKKQPYVPFDEKEIQKGATVKHIPNLGDYRPKGWRLVDHWLCDNSGFGSENEPALTASQLQAAMQAKYNERATCGYGIIEVGPFQVVLGVFRKVEKKRFKHEQRRSTNTTEKRLG
jgi:hypothetical protein